MPKTNKIPVASKPNRYFSPALAAAFVVIVVIFILASVGVDLLVKYRAQKAITTTTPPVPTTSQTSKEAASDLSAMASDIDLRLAAQATFKGSGFQPVSDLGQIDGVRHRVVSYQVGDLTEYAYLTLPVAPQPLAGYPIIIICHGYVKPDRFKTFGNSYLPDMEFYSRHGYVAIRPDFRGNGSSQGSPEGAYYSMAYNIDLMELIASIKKANYIDPSNINIWGHSMGGYLALRAAVLSPDIRTAIILAGAVGTVNDLYNDYFAPSDRLNPVALELRNKAIHDHGSPVDNPSYWFNTSPLNFLDKTSALIQIHVGAKDAVVPSHFSKDLDEELNKNQKSHEYYVYNDGDHGLVAQRDQIWQRSLALLNKPTFTNQPE